MKDYYLILKLNRLATETEIKKSYRTLAMEWHPDRNHNKEAHEMFILINEAYEILSDQHRRSEYDRIFFNSEIVTTEFNNWQSQAKSRGEQYADMGFENYKSKILDEIILVAKYSPGFGCLAFILFGIVEGLWFIIQSSKEDDGIMVQVGVITLIFSGVLAIWAYPRFTIGYKEDRNKMNNK
jgi:curved DNA-binding protein CbpA